MLGHGVRERSNIFGKVRERKVENVLEELEDRFENEVLGLKFSFECVIV